MTGAALALAGCTATARRAGHLLALDATAQADLVRRGEVGAADPMEATLDRIQALNPSLNAIVTPGYDTARAQARQTLPSGPFTGVPYALKDLVDWQGARRSAGSRLLREPVSDRTDDIVSRSLAAGLVPVGKTNTPEFALNASTEPLLFGPARNPWDLARSAGGSSGGAAVAVAAGLLPFAHASDGGGSIRIPASCCGLFGLKPSRGRMVGSRPGDSGVEHCLSRSVRDSATLFAWNQRQDAAAPLPPVTLTHRPPARRLRMAYALKGWTGATPSAAVRLALDETARLCTALGHDVEAQELPIEGEPLQQHFMAAWSHGAARAVALARSR